MNLKNVSDKDLLLNTERLALKERELLVDVLHHLREIDRRRLFSHLGFSSLFNYAVKKLGYSEDQAYRRIQAMKALKEMPEVEEKIETGALTLTALSLAQSYFRTEEKSKRVSVQEKRKLLERLEHTSSREAQRVIASISPTLPIRDQIKPIGESLVEVKFSAPQALIEKLDKLKGLLAHSNPNISMAELIDKLSDISLERLNPQRSLKKKPKPLHVPLSASKSSVKVSSQLRRASPPAAGLPPAVAVASAPQSAAAAAAIPNKPSPTSPWTSKKTRVISKPLRRYIFQRDLGKCRHCGSHHALEIDHILPLAQGGATKPRNLRLLCRSCNQRKAIEHFGARKMEKYLDRQIIKT